MSRKILTVVHTYVLYYTQSMCDTNVMCYLQPVKGKDIHAFLSGFAE